MLFRPNATPVVAAINVIPMADIMLVLLIIFMVVTPLFQPGVPVDLPPARNSVEMTDADREDAVLLAIARDGTIYLGRNHIALEQIRSRAGDLTAQRPDKLAFVKSDRRARFGRVVAVIEEVRSAGIERIGLLTEKADRTGKEATDGNGSR